MKRTLLSVMTLAAVCLTAQAQTVVFMDNFDSYTAGDYLGTQSSDWTTWSNMPGTTEDAFVSDEQANSGANSVKLESAGGNGPTDLVLPLGNLTTGNYAVSMYVYVVAGNGAYFNIQHFEAPGMEWAIEVYFDDAGGGELDTDGTTTAFSYTQDTWVLVVVNVDLDNDMATMLVEGTVVHSWPWNTQASGGAGANQLGGINIYAAAPTGQSALYYVDDVQLTQLNVGIDEATGLAALTIAPNPAVDVLNVAGKVSSQATMRVVDLTGKELAPAISRNVLNQVSMDVSALVPGVYFLEVTDGNDRIVKRFVKE